MRDTWYGDRPDLVKWGTLIHLACGKNIKQIIQVAFFREGKRPKLQIKSQNNTKNSTNICEEVWSHFRNLNSIKILGESKDLDIEVLDCDFDAMPRQEYVDKVCNLLKNKSGKKIILLDPDTGIEPKTPTRKHVKKKEVAQFWVALCPSDWLVLYQHSNRTRNWQECARSKFQCACGNVDVETFASEELTKEVAFFAAKKR